jgi:hypothetical protein
MIAAMIRKAAASAALAILLLASGATGSSAASKPPDITDLFTQAVATVRAQPDFARAVVLEADGSPAHAGSVNGAGKIVKWRFVFDNSTPGSNFMSVTVNYSHGKFGRVVGHEAPFLEDVEIKQAPKMTLKEAVSLLESAG